MHTKHLRKSIAINSNLPRVAPKVGFIVNEVLNALSESLHYGANGVMDPKQASSTVFSVFSLAFRFS